MTRLAPEKKSDKLLQLANIGAALEHIAQAMHRMSPGDDHVWRLTAVETELRHLRAELRKEAGLD